MALQNDIESIQDKLQRGQISADEANVQIVQCQGVRLVTKMPTAVRSVLNAAVKQGRLGHMKKDGKKLEAYFHINARAKAISARNKAEREALTAIQSILGQANRPLLEDCQS